MGSVWCDEPTICGMRRAAGHDIGIGQRFINLRTETDDAIQCPASVTCCKTDDYQSITVPEFTHELEAEQIFKAAVDLVLIDVPLEHTQEIVQLLVYERSFHGIIIKGKFLEPRGQLELVCGIGH